MKKMILFPLVLLTIWLVIGLGNGFESEDIIAQESSLPDDAEVNDVLVHEAKNQAELEEQWDYFNLEEDLPSMDWEDSAVLFLGTYEARECPVVIEDVEVEDKEESLSFKYKKYDECNADGAPKTIALKIEKSIMEKVQHIEFRGKKIEI